MAFSSSPSSYRELEITLISASDLKDVNLITKLEVYAVVLLSGDHRTEQRTPTDRNGRRNPEWNHPIRFHVPSAAETMRLSLDFYLRCERSLGDRDVGEVHVPVNDLEPGGGDGKTARFVTYQVRRASGKPQGVLYFSYRFGDHVSAPAPAAKKDEPVLAYPAGDASKTHQPPPVAPYPPPAGYPTYAQTPSLGYAHAAPQVGGHGRYGYGGPAPPTYAYGYGEPPVAQPQRPPKKSKMGLGTGLLAGALGGLLIGDVLSDASAYDAGYDAGFDAGGFDF